QGAPDIGGDTGDAADDERGELLEAMADAERVDHRHRRQQADEMAGEQDEDAHVEQVRSDHHLPAAQELARLRAPAILARVEAQDAADDEDGDGEIGIPAERELIDEFVHCPASFATERLNARILATAPVGPPISCAAPAPNVTGASSHSSSIAGSTGGVLSSTSATSSARGRAPLSATRPWKIAA